MSTYAIPSPVVLVGLAASTLWACGDDSTNPLPGTSSSSSQSSTASAGGATSASSSSSSTSASSSSSSGSGGAPPMGVKSGSVAVFSGASSATNLHGHHVTAAFIENADGTPGVYTSSTFGPCTVKVYSTPPALGTKNYQSAGLVTVSGGTSVVTLTPDGTKKYPANDDTTTDLFTGGETITVSVAGADVPAFMTTVTAPSTVDLKTPVEPSGTAPLPVDRTVPLTFTWTGGSAGHVIVIMNGPPATQLRCSFPSVDGTGTIPAAALGELQASSTGLFAIQPAEDQELMAGDYRISILVGNSLTWSGVVNPQTFSFQATN